MSEALLASQALLGPDGNPRASTEQVLHTPSVIIPVVVTFFAVTLGLALGIGYYWHEIELAKKIHPDEVGYGHWYFAGFFRILFTVLVAVVFVALCIIIAVVIDVFPGPIEAQAYLQGKQQAQQSKTLSALEQAAVSVAQARAARFRQTQQSDAGGQQLTAM